MSETLTIIARIEAKKESLELVKSEIVKLIEPTLKEEGCMQYDLHQDNEEPEVFIFFENWATKALWERHNESTHLAEFIKATEGALESLLVNQMRKV